jgi:hypothetical protein
MLSLKACRTASGPLVPQDGPFNGDREPLAVSICESILIKNTIAVSSP